MSEYDELLELAVEALGGPVLENIKRRCEKERLTPAEINKKIKAERDHIEWEVTTNIGSIWELRLNFGLSNTSTREFREEMEVLADPRSFPPDKAALPSVQRDELRDLSARIRAVQSCYRRLNWATMEKLEKVSSPKVWDDLDRRLDEAASEVEVATGYTPNPRGGPVASQYPWLLVNICHWTFDSLRPDKASSDEGNDFRKYVAYIHELATGEREGDYVGDVKRRLSFERAIKEELGRWRKHIPPVSSP